MGVGVGVGGSWEVPALALPVLCSPAPALTLGLTHSFADWLCSGLWAVPSTELIASPLPIPARPAMDPQEMVVKNPFAHISIPRAHLRPELGQQLEVAPFCPESQALPGGSCTLEPTEENTGPKGAKGAAPFQGQQAWQQPSNPYGSGPRPSGLTYAGLPPIGHGDDIAHHCCCCPCCSCCHCPRFCRCHSCCCVIS